MLRNEAVHKIGDGAASIAAGVSMLIPVVSGVYAAWTASRTRRLEAMNADPQIVQVIAKRGTAARVIADLIPGDKVTSGH
jgi:hypothetical protein